MAYDEAQKLIYSHGRRATRVAGTALVTGGATGIGRGIALALARRRCSVALVGRRATLLEATAREISEKYGIRAVPLPADLADPAQVAQVVERAHEALGPLDILVNSAAVLMGGDLSTLTQEEVGRAVATNLTAPIALTHQVLPDLRERKGAIILIASAMSEVPMPSASIYSATKAGIRAFAEALRYELRPLGIHLLVAYPPATDTDMIRGMDRAAGLPSFPMQSPEAVSERIVRALMMGRNEIRFGASDRVFTIIYRLLPWIVRSMLYSQRTRFARMMTAWRSRPPRGKDS